MSEPETPNDALARYELQLADAEAAAKIAILKAESLRKIVEGLRSFIDAEMTAPTPAQLWRPTPSPFAARRAEPAATTVSSPETPRGREAVRLVLIEDRGTMHLDEIEAAVTQRGWMEDVADRRNALGAAATRLVRDGEIERVGPSRFRYRIEKLPPLMLPEPDSDDSGDET
jgi:hypothetical protein